MPSLSALGVWVISVSCAEAVVLAKRSSTAKPRILVCMFASFAPLCLPATSTCRRPRVLCWRSHKSAATPPRAVADGPAQPSDGHSGWSTLRRLAGLQLALSGDAMLRWGGGPSAARLLALTAVYVAAGKLGLSLALVHASASPVWPPTGIALAAFLLLGRSVWPAIFAGAFLVNVTTEGNAGDLARDRGRQHARGMAGAELVRRFAGGTAAFDRPAGRLQVRRAGGPDRHRDQPHDRRDEPLPRRLRELVGVRELWLTWWLGDAGGAVVVAPALVLWAQRPWPRWTRAQRLEVAGLLATIAAVGVIAFGGVLPAPGGDGSLQLPLSSGRDLDGVPVRTARDRGRGVAALGLRGLGNGARHRTAPGAGERGRWCCSSSSWASSR